jgi:hypothetical protein
MRILYCTTLFAALLFAASCDQKNTMRDVSPEDVFNSKSASKKESIPTTSVKFDKDTFNFGTVIEGEKVSYAFTFTNTGDRELVIANAYGSCGCTVPEYSKKPIAPGAKGVINVVFDSQNRVGENTKTVTVVTNTEPSIHKLYLIGTVEK